MKAGREHRVPLAPRCVEILEQATRLTNGGPQVFPGRRPTRPLSNMVFLMALRRDGSRGHHNTWVPFLVSRLGGGADAFPAHSLQSGPGAHRAR